jgi:hypothetical protein
VSLNHGLTVADHINNPPGNNPYVPRGWQSHHYHRGIGYGKLAAARNHTLSGDSAELVRCYLPVSTPRVRSVPPFPATGCNKTLRHGTRMRAHFRYRGDQPLI